MDKIQKGDSVFLPLAYGSAIEQVRSILEQGRITEEQALELIFAVLDQRKALGLED